MGLYGVRWTDPEYPAFLMQDGTELTFGQVRDFFGDEIDADPPTIAVDDGGYGGDEGLWFQYGIEIVRGGFEAAGAVATILGAQRQLARLRFAEYRRLAKQWNDTGTISTELSDLVYNHGTWDRPDFDRAFNLGDLRGPDLLRALGYERREDDWGTRAGGGSRITTTGSVSTSDVERGCLVRHPGGLRGKGLDLFGSHIVPRDKAADGAVRIPVDHHADTREPHPDAEAVTPPSVTFGPEQVEGLGVA